MNRQNSASTTTIAPGGAVNLPELLARLEGDHEFLCELIVAFQKTFPPLLQSLQQSVAQLDMKSVMTSSHTLKGMLAGLCVTRAAAAALCLEQMARAGTAAGLADTLKVLEDEVTNLLPELQTYMAKPKS